MSSTIIYVLVGMYIINAVIVHMLINWLMKDIDQLRVRIEVNETIIGALKRWIERNEHEKK